MNTLYSHSHMHGQWKLFCGQGKVRDFFLSWWVATLKLLHNCEDRFHFYSLSVVHIYDLYHMHTISLSSYDEYKLNSLLTCFQRGFIAPLVEHRTGIAEVMGSNPVEASDFFLGFICNCLSYFITARITFTCILYPQFIYVIHIICTSSQWVLCW